MTTHHHDTQAGFVALIMVLVLSAVMMVAVVSLSRTGIMARYALFELEQKTISESRARGCLSAARTLLAQDYNYRTLHLPVHSGDGTCTIENITGTDTELRITVSSTEGRATTNYLADVDMPSMQVVRFIELTE